MVSAAVRAALEGLWVDRATVTARRGVTDPATCLTDFEEVTLCADLPCKLSFETLRPAEQGAVATAEQTVKLICAPDVSIPAGCQISVTRPDGGTFLYTRAGAAGVFFHHQEILLEPWRGWA